MRHKGFIPWDDDADVAMTRAEFRRLYEHLRQEDTGFFITERIKTQFRCQEDPEIWVDIFICDPIIEHPFSQKVKLLLLTVLDIMSKIMLLAVAIILIFSDTGMDRNLFRNRLCYALGRFSIPIYLSHLFYAYYINQYVSEEYRAPLKTPLSGYGRIFRSRNAS